ncbi:MAG: hypothetical protein J0L94_05515 [Rhodothermia bacterium]|nr:hypothetical protein [Rhodothermia bacterium]
MYSNESFIGGKSRLVEKNKGLIEENVRYGAFLSKLYPDIISDWRKSSRIYLALNTQTNHHFKRRKPR